MAQSKVFRIFALINRFAEPVCCQKILTGSERKVVGLNFLKGAKHESVKNL